MLLFCGFFVNKGCQNIETMICYSLKNIDVHENNAYYKSVDGKLYSKDGIMFIQYALGKPDETFLVDSSVFEISYRAFSGCYSLKNIEVEEGNPSYKSHRWKFVHYGCKKLKKVEMSNSVVEIGDWAFMNCPGLVEISLSNNLSEIKNEVFAYCESLESIVIPSSVSSINYAAFRGCSLLKNVSISNSTTCIGEYAFYDCVSLESIVIPKSVELIEATVFYNCPSITIY